MQQTTNYALKKIELADSPPDITVLNPNFDTIDTKLKENADAIESHKADNVVHVTTIEKLAWSGKQDALPAENKRKITYGTAIPTTLAEGEIYFQYE